MAKTHDMRLQEILEQVEPDASPLAKIRTEQAILRDWYDVKLTKLDPEARVTAFDKILKTKYREVGERVKPIVQRLLTDWANQELPKENDMIKYPPMTEDEITAWNKQQQLKRRLVYLYKRWGKTRLTKKDKRRFLV